MPINALLTLANDLHQRRLVETDLPDVMRQVPLDESTLYDLIHQANSASRQQPRQGWAIMAVAAAAATNHLSPFPQALAAWHLGRLNNEYARPLQARETLAQARHLFTELNEPGWLAACTWQENALPSASLNLPQSITALQNALETLENAEDTLVSLAPQCRFTLATTQLMVGDLASARPHIQGCEQIFRANRDPFNLGRCLLAKISCGRRTGQMDSVLRWLDEVWNLVADWPAEKARVSLQKGYIRWLNQGDYEGAIAAFMESARIYTALDMPIGIAQAQDGLAQIYTTTGKLQDVPLLLQQALSQATTYGAIGVQADVLLDLGWYETQSGNPQKALVHTQSATQIYERMENQGMYAAALMHLGDAYMQLGRYQLALRTLEKSHDQFKQLAMTSRLAECELRLAGAWFSLGQAQMAHLYLNQASEHARQANHPTIWPYLYYRQAVVHAHQADRSAALNALEEGLQIAHQQNDPHSLALMQRAMAEMLLAQEKPAEARPYLVSASTSFETMGMVMEVMLCRIQWGHYYRQTGDDAQASMAWEEALEWSLDTMPDISWHAAAGLALLAENQHQNHTALTHYRQVKEALSQLRQGFWQPELVNSFSQRPAATLDRAVHLAIRVGTSQDVLAFIEENKARLTARQIRYGQHQSTTTSSTELQARLAQIRWLQEQLHTTRTTYSRVKKNPLNQELAVHVEAYRDARSRWMRDQQGDPGVPLDVPFEQGAFIHKATEVLGTDWLALDYYLTDEQLQGVVITPGGSYTWAKKMNQQAERALLDMERYGWQTDEDEGSSPLRTLGQFLIPEAVLRQLKPTTVLIIAPHRRLHYVPWAALQVGDKPLVAACIPALTLSLSNLMSLWSRPRTHPSPLTSGLLLATSTFPDYRQPLPDVVAECDRVRPHLGTNSQSLCEADATWANFQALGQAQGLARFSFWHVASHAVLDRLTGRLSGISFYDRDVPLDELWQCAPLPQLVTLSACSGSKSKLYEGDEHISLATTCLSAGAQTVVGSLWPVPDREMPRLMHDFYAALANGEPVALALALAQRAAWNQNRSWRFWGGLTCTGVPD
ncbi:MAG: CHAT domain-containing protein [Chloroflexi bacterium]|nr:CHAT domain-containing protein [Chloroflexota bacterium]